ncbi:type I 3-dehydroquinase family protein, partial [Chlamydia psittaci 06-1683]
AFFHH